MKQKDGVESFVYSTKQKSSSFKVEVSQKERGESLRAYMVILENLG